MASAAENFGADGAGFQTLEAEVMDPVVAKRGGFGGSQARVATSCFDSPVKRIPAERRFSLRGPAQQLHVDPV